MNNKLILMTGATGFLGSHLLKSLLDDHYKVIILKRSFSYTSRITDIMNKVEHCDIDKTDPADIFLKNKIDIILHCATNYGRDNSDRLTVLDANLMLPLKLLELGLKNNISHFINTDTLLDKRISHYSLSKTQFKEWLKTYSNQLTCANIAIEHFYGPFDDKTKFVSFVIDKILNQAQAIDLTPGMQKRDFIYIDDVVSAFMKILKCLADRPKGFYPFEIGSGKLITIKDLATKIKGLADNKTTKLNFGALPYRQNEIMESHVDTRAVHALGWKPVYSLEEGLKLTIDSQRKAMKIT